MRHSMSMIISERLAHLGAASRHTEMDGYHQRGPLEHTLFGLFPRLFLGCINADSASKAAFFSIFQALHIFFCTIPDFCDFASLRTTFCKILLIFCGFSKKTADFTDFHRISTDCCRNFAEFHRISIVLQRVMPRLLHFREI